MEHAVAEEAAADVAAAVGSLLEGEFDYCIVDGNVEADPVAKISPRRRARITAVA